MKFSMEDTQQYFSDIFSVKVVFRDFYATLVKKEYDRKQYFPLRKSLIRTFLLILRSIDSQFSENYSLLTNCETLLGVQLLSHILIRTINR